MRTGGCKLLTSLIKAAVNYSRSFKQTLFIPVIAADNIRWTGFTCASTGRHCSAGTICGVHTFDYGFVNLIQLQVYINFFISFN